LSALNRHFNLSLLLLEHELLGRRAQRLHILLAARFRVGPHHRLRSGKPVTNHDPSSRITLSPSVRTTRPPCARSVRRISLQLLSERIHPLRSQAEVLPIWIEGTNFANSSFICAPRLLPRVATSRPPAARPAPILLRHMPRWSVPRLLAADGNLVFVDQFADELEPTGVS